MLLSWSIASPLKRSRETGTVLAWAASTGFVGAEVVGVDVVETHTSLKQVSPGLRVPLP